MQLLSKAINFISQRERKWALITFIAERTDPYKVRLIIGGCLKNSDLRYFHDSIGLYYKPGYIKNIFVKKIKVNRFFNDLHTFIKAEKGDDPKFVQNILRFLPRSFMQRYFQERSADPDFTFTGSVFSPHETREEEESLNNHTMVELEKHSRQMKRLIQVNIDKDL